MTIKDLIEDFLEKTPKFRERKWKDAGIVHLLIQKHYGGSFPKDRHDLIRLVKDYASADRAWRQALEHNKDLRGSDYDDKKLLVTKKQQELGYHVDGK